LVICDFKNAKESSLLTDERESLCNTKHAR
jgi:hypothetical protein